MRKIPKIKNSNPKAPNYWETMAVHSRNRETAKQLEHSKEDREGHEMSHNTTFI